MSPNHVCRKRRHHSGPGAAVPAHRSLTSSYFLSASSAMCLASFSWISCSSIFSSSFRALFSMTFMPLPKKKKQAQQGVMYETVPHKPAQRADAAGLRETQQPRLPRANCSSEHCSSSSSGSWAMRNAAEHESGCRRDSARASQALSRPKGRRSQVLMAGRQLGPAAQRCGQLEVLGGGRSPPNHIPRSGAPCRGRGSSRKKPRAPAAPFTSPGLPRPRFLLPQRGCAAAGSTPRP